MPGLIDLGTKYFERGLRLLFFPCNQCCSEEPGTAADIAAFYAAGALRAKTDADIARMHTFMHGNGGVPSGGNG